MTSGPHSQSIMKLHNTEKYLGVLGNSDLLFLYQAMVSFVRVQPHPQIPRALLRQRGEGVGQGREEGSR